MTFTENEVRFLSLNHGRLSPIFDVRTLGCSESIFFKILEDRARKLGNEFTEFRNSNNKPTETASDTNLAAEIAANKLF